MKYHQLSTIHSEDVSASSIDSNKKSRRWAQRIGWLSWRSSLWTWSVSLVGYFTFKDKVLRRSHSRRSTTSSRQPNSTFSPKSSSEYFDQALQVSLPDRGLDVRVYYTPQRSQNGGMFVLHHGAGYSGTSFACLAKVLVEVMKGEVGVLAFDARGHGPFNLRRLRAISVIIFHRKDCAFNFGGESVRRKSRWRFLCSHPVCLFEDWDRPCAYGLSDFIVLESNRNCIFQLVGHSMGGSVVVHACPKLQELKYTVSGVVVLDVVEGVQMLTRKAYPTAGQLSYISGTAMEALPYMHTLLDTRPEGFHSVEDAIEWQ